MRRGFACGSCKKIVETRQAKRLTTKQFTACNGVQMIGRVHEGAKPAETLGVGFQQAYQPLVPLAEVYSVLVFLKICCLNTQATNKHKKKSKGNSGQ
jgi:hypothetical protein